MNVSILWLENDRVLNGIDNRINDVSYNKSESNPSKFNSSLFHDNNLILSICDEKDKFHNIDQSLIDSAVKRSNIHEILFNPFQNRAGMKLAEIDISFSRIFSSPTRKQITFLDLCGGPGAFVEYIYYQRNYTREDVQTIGFGTTLRNCNMDYNLSNDILKQFIIFSGKSNNGDICNLDNMKDLIEFIENNSKDGSVDFVLADGSRNLKKVELGSQECLNFELLLAELLISLKVMKTGGNLLIKMFDLTNQLTVGLVYILYRSFRHISIFKPNFSRSSNSEKYLICNEKVDKGLTIFFFNELFMNINSLHDITKIFEKYQIFDEMMEDISFRKYIKKINLEIDYKQLLSLKKVSYFIINPQLDEISKQLKFMNLINRIFFPLKHHNSFK